jgi:hypothetical protein
MSPDALPAETRLQRRVVWETLVFVLAGTLYIFLGFQSRAILSGLAAPDASLSPANLLGN